MKTRLLIFIGLVIFSSYIFFSLYSFDENRPFEIPKLQCGEKYIQISDTCQLNPELIESNTVVIYDMHRTQGSRTSIAPHNLVMNLTNGNTVTFVNNASNTVNILDNSKGIWKFEDVKPQTERSITINGTGYYQFLVQDSRHGRTGEIIALSKETNSLPVEIKAKMAQTIVGSDFRKNVGLLSVGSGGAEPGITIGIHEKFQDEPDAEQFYYEKYKNMIPFDVPIWIEFHAPIVLQTG